MAKRKMRKFADGGIMDPEYRSKIDAMKNKENDEKIVRDSADASKTSTKIKAHLSDALSSVGSILHPKIVEENKRLSGRSSEVEHFRNMERQGADAQKRLDAAKEKNNGMKKGGVVKMAKGGSASSRADGCATKGKTRGMMR